MCVEVFKTNVTCPEASRQLIQQLLSHFPLFHINFDLEDCDRILRIEGDEIPAAQVIKLLDHNGYLCEVLI